MKTDRELMHDFYMTIMEEVAPEAVANGEYKLGQDPSDLDVFVDVRVLVEGRKLHVVVEVTEDELQFEGRGNTFGLALLDALNGAREDREEYDKD